MKTKLVFMIALSVLSIISLTGILSAGFQLGNKSYSLEVKYGNSQPVKGWINISFSDEPSDSKISDSFGNSIILIDFLNLTNKSYSCNPTNCEADYFASDLGSTTKKIKFEENFFEEKIGIKLTGIITEINSISFDIQSDAVASCEPQLKISILEDKNISFSNNKTAPIYSCPSLKDYGCFNLSAPPEMYVIGESQYCQKINLSESPSFKVGAWVKKVSGTRNITMELKDDDFVSLGGCFLPEASTSGSEISCSINYQNKKKGEYYLCLYSNQGEGIYNIKGYGIADGCGFYGAQIPSSFNAAYGFFAEGKKFDAFGTLHITQELTDGRNLNEEIIDYIYSKYGSLNCTRGCIIPITILATASRNGQVVTFSNLQLSYSKNTGSVTETRFYSIDKSPARINMGFEKINVDPANFLTPNTKGNHTFTLKIGDSEVLSERFTIDLIPIIGLLSPTTTASAFPTLFQVNISNNKNITKYEWNFSDGTANEITTQNKVIHTYNSTGNYTIRLKITNINGLSASKEFNITVRTPQQEINNQIVSIDNAIKNIITEISKYNLFYQRGINSSINISDLKYELDKIKQENASANKSERKLNEIMISTLSLKIPKSILTTAGSNLITFYPNENVNLEILEELSKENLTKYDKSKIASLISYWDKNAIEMKISFEEISARYETEEKPILNVFKVKILKKTSMNYSVYLIINKLENMEFESNELNLKEKEEYYYTDLKETSADLFSFSTTEDVQINNLDDIFISPGFKQLSLLEEQIEPPEKSNTKILKNISIILAIIFAAGLLVYLFLQMWNRKKYEDRLFENKNDLYNILNYINHSKAKRMTNEQIIINLKKSKWSQHQIRYAMKKHSGDYTDVPKLNLKNLFKKGGYNK